MKFGSCDLTSFRDLVCNTLLIKIKNYLYKPKIHTILFYGNNFEGERGDSNPRIAAPQAAALTTWRRPPHIMNLTTHVHNFILFFVL